MTYSFSGPTALLYPQKHEPGKRGRRGPGTLGLLPSIGPFESGGCAVVTPICALICLACWGIRRTAPYFGAVMREAFGACVALLGLVLAMIALAGSLAAPRD